ncbi:hypothetical protein GCM10008018_64610 [Paenibacillus marchantiophytorum]|uniref:SGNH hydrolase-type esterase domain-containing protein n=1 Tax=Paenibacillus marchantiophytorum TaxID=1619310 RepID=A0ABQ1FG21_9BACL|nr:SGNH/GDSL hydrolase family protein [Paenibacillus marchantiophytorum]GGA10252.1 hypothetical protein GCM10008018_64610 [Paenibacillus marchantiophytorum]
MTEPIRIILLGDSITEDGTYITYMDAYCQQFRRENTYTFINRGLSSETASGLSEDDHPFPRPCVHDRLASVLQETKPDWVIIGYGMNDGIYAPFSTERFEAYQEGMMKAIRLIHRCGAKAIVMTPPPFDPLCVEAGTLLPEGELAYSYKTPYQHYNDVLRIYADWILSLGSVVERVVNIYDPLFHHRQVEREKCADYRSGDGIHPNSDGHWVIATTLLSHLFYLSNEEVPEFVKQPGSAPLT